MLQHRCWSLQRRPLQRSIDAACALEKKRGGTKIMDIFMKVEGKKD